MSYEPINEILQEEDTLDGKYLSFPLNNVMYGIEIRAVTEVIRYQEITEVPNMPIFIKGVINLRDTVIPVMDVRVRFHLPEKKYDDRTCTIVVNIDGFAMGLVVDTVEGVISIPKENVDPPIQARKDMDAQFIAGMGKIGQKVTILLDVNKLLFKEELEEIKEISNG